MSSDSGDIGAIVEATVSRLTRYGLFVERDVPSGRRAGLVHISEIADGYVQNVADHYQVGDRIRVKVIGRDDRGRDLLSARQANPGEGVPRRGEAGDATFEDRLKRFMRESQERLLDLKRHTETKRGGARR